VTAVSPGAPRSSGKISLSHTSANGSARVRQARKPRCDGKLALRYEFTPGFAVRGSASNGFRAPSLHQQVFTTTSTNFISGVPVDILTLPVSSPIARALGSRDLKAEKSLNFSGGVTANPLSGLTLTEAMARVRREIEAERIAIDRAAQDLVSRGLAIWSSDGADRPVLIVRGQANLLDDSAVGDLDRVRQLLDELETKQDIAQLLDSARDGAATRIFIGSENKLFSLSGSSVIAAPYRGSDGRVVGVVGVIGPTRLNYARIVPMVDFTAQSLSRLIR